MTDPFTRHSIDGTENSLIPMKVVEQLFLKPLPSVIALRLESPASETSRDRIIEQWALSRGQAEFLINNLRECLDSAELAH